MYKRPSSTIPVLALLVAAFQAQAFGADAVKLLDEDTFGKGSSVAETILRVPELGRYLVTAESSSGAVLTLVDRMHGRLARSGNISGTQAFPGRVEAFLEPGEYKIVVEKSKDATVRLSARPFRIVNAGKTRFDVPLFKNGERFSAKLGDTDAYAFWIRIDERQPAVNLEIRGRNLGGAVLWENGLWETGVQPVRSKQEFIKGQPVTCLEFNRDMKPGLYLLTCYGGMPVVWANDSKDTPFDICMDVPYYGRFGVVSLTIPPSGVDSFLVSGDADFCQLVTPNNSGYNIGMAPYGEDRSRYGFSRSQSVNEKSISYIASLNDSRSSQRKWIVVSGKPGETVEVRFLRSGGSGWTTISAPSGDRGSTEYLTTILGAAEGEDSCDLTAFISERKNESNGTTSYTVRQYLAVDLDADKPIRRRINNLGANSFIVKAGSRGNYAVYEASSRKTGPLPSAKYSFQLLDDFLAQNNRGARTIEGSGTIDLLDKAYVVTITPKIAGILDFVMLISGFNAAGKAKALLDSPPVKAVNSLTWASTPRTASSSASQSLWLASRDSVPGGSALRFLPLDISDPPCIRLDAGQSAGFTFSCGNAITLFSSNRSFRATVDGVPITPSTVIKAGRHVLSISNPGSKEAWHTVYSRLAGDAKAFIPPDESALMDAFGRFAEGEPAYGAWDRSETKYFLLTVKEGSLYRMETTGRLSMRVSVRGLLRTGLFKAEANHAGRNAVVSSYLGPGKYLVSVQALGQTRGRAGVVISKMPMADGGTLVKNGISRNTVAAGSLLAVNLSIDAEATWAISCESPGRSCAYRLEDADGWPVLDPVGSGAVEAFLRPGRYRYLSLPLEFDTRRVVALADAADRSDDKFLEGKKNAISVNERYRKRWMESPGREEDEFAFSLPARADLRLSVSETMVFDLVDAAGTSKASGRGGPATALTLDRGTYRIRVRAAKENNLLDYGIMVSSYTLLENNPLRAMGESSGSIPVSVAEPGLYEIMSRGPSDLDAFLFDRDGNIVAMSEPIPDDWNFRIVADLLPGIYSLALVRAGSGAAAMSLPATASQAIPPDVEASSDEGERYDEAGYDEGEDYDSEEYYDEATYDEGSYEEGSYDEEVPPDEEYHEEDPYDGESLAGSSSGLFSADMPEPAVTPATFNDRPSGDTALTLVFRKEILQSARQGAFELSGTQASEVASIPWSVKDPGVWTFRADQGSAVSIAVYKGRTSLYSGRGSVSLPLLGGTDYTLRCWKSDPEPSRITFRAAAGKTGNVELSQVSRDLTATETFLRISGLDTASALVSGNADSLLFSPGPEKPFKPVERAALSAVSGELWLSSGNGEAIGALTVRPLVLESGTPVPVTTGTTEPVFRVVVPEKQVMLVRTENGGNPAGLSVVAAPQGKAAQPIPYDWDNVLSTPLSSLAGLAPGSYTGKAWDPYSKAIVGDRTIVLSSDAYAIAEERKLRETGQDVVAVPPRAAIAFVVAPGGREVRLTLERGLVAFGWNKGPRGMLAALDAGATGSLESDGGFVYVVNTLAAGAFCGAGAAPSSAPRLALSESRSWESTDAFTNTIRIPVSLKDRKSVLFLHGDFVSAVFLNSESGKADRGLENALGAGKSLSFAGARGVLEIKGGTGFLRAWASLPPDAASAFVEKSPKARAGVLALSGSTLSNAPESWSFQTQADARLFVRADGPGMLALFDGDGKLVAFDSSAASDRAVIASLPKGRYTAFTRPIGSLAQSGGIAYRELAEEPLKPGEGKDTIIGPGESRLFGFRVSADGRVGAGIRTDGDTLGAALYDSRFRLIATGTLFYRELAKGDYFLLVGKASGVTRFRPVLYGAEGSLADIPADVLRQYK